MSLYPWGVVPQSSPLLAQACVSKFCLLQGSLPPSLHDGSLGSQALQGSTRLPCWPSSCLPVQTLCPGTQLPWKPWLLAAAPIPPRGAASWEQKPVFLLPFLLLYPCLVFSLASLLCHPSQGLPVLSGTRKEPWSRQSPSREDQRHRLFCVSLSLVSAGQWVLKRKGWVRPPAGPSPPSEVDSPGVRRVRQGGAGVSLLRPQGQDLSP